MNVIEKCGEKFNLNHFISAQEKTKNIVLEFSKKIVPGMNEKETHALFDKFLLDSEVEKKWHPTKLRMGPNTTKSFREESQDYTLLENDLFFFDIGPVFFEHEGDYGQTFAIGNNPTFHELAQAPEHIFQLTKKAWIEKKLNGIELYQFAEFEAKKLGLKLNTNMYGHRLGDFPHALYSRDKLGEIDFNPAPKLWVLEIHLINEKLDRGAFFEDILF